MTYQQSVFKRYHSDKHLSEFLPTRWQQKSTGIDVEQNYVTVTLCIKLCCLATEAHACEHSSAHVSIIQYCDPSVCLSVCPSVCLMSIAHKRCILGL